MDPLAAGDRPATPRRRPRDAQRSRVYLAETPLPASPLPGLDACARYVDRVVGTLWWHERFPDHGPCIGAAPPPRPGRRARRSSAWRTPARPSPCRGATAPRVSCSTSSRTGRSASTPASRTTAVRSPASCSTPPQSSGAPTTRRCSRRPTASNACTSASRPAAGPDGCLRYGWDERLRLGKGTCSRWRSRPPTASRRPSPARSSGTSGARRSCGSRHAGGDEITARDERGMGRAR